MCGQAMSSSKVGDPQDTSENRGNIGIQSVALDRTFTFSMM